MREICDRHGVLLILDEVLTGFGRTGRRFAADHWRRPGPAHDGQGRLWRVRTARRSRGSAARPRGVRGQALFEHIFTFGGPGVGGRRARRPRIWEREGLTERAAGLEAAFTAALDRLREHPFVGDVRVTGLMAGIEFVADRETKEPFDPSMKFGTRVREAGLRNGIVTYPGIGHGRRRAGRHHLALPAVDVTEADIAEIAERLEATFVDVERDLRT